MQASTATLIALTVIAGGMLPIQFAINARLATKLDSTAILAALISVIVSTIALLVVAFATLDKWPRWEQLKDAPSWMWIGGVLGAVFVASSTFVVPKIGASVFVAAVLFGQIVVSMLIDHNGYLGVPTDPVTLQRVLGLTLVFAGLLIIR